MQATTRVAVIEQIDQLLKRAGLPPGNLPPWEYWEDESDGARMTLAAAWAAGIERLTPRGSQYRELLQDTLSRYTPADALNLASMAGILNAIRNDVEAGYVQSIEELVHADLFGDFLEMAAELLDKGYKNPAAVLGGSVLEEHMRKLAAKHAVPVETGDRRPRKADTINADLVKAGAYNNLVQKQITAWLDLRNKAAHGRYDEYGAEQVALVLEGVRGFLVNQPA
jgi:hypothetical protein